MKLLSATVRNYRIHQELTIVFDESRTVIGGANETGKSTFIEAVHRGLFLKSTVTGQAHKSMVSKISSGHPEVELHFKAHEKEYHLTKRYSGANGTTQLIQTGGETWQGEEAESQLAGLLGVEESGGGRGIIERISSRWAHLWVWQGKSGDDPSIHAASEQTRLLQQLQKSGGTVAMQSELDGKVAARFTEAKEKIYVRSGKTKVGSDLEKAETAVQSAEQEHEVASGKLEILRQFIADFEHAEAIIFRTESDRADNLKERIAVNEKIAKTEALQRAEKEQTSAVEIALEKLVSLEDLENKIKSLRTSIVSLKELLSPRQEEEKELEFSLTDSRIRATAADQKYEEALKTTREARFRKELAAAYVNRFEKETRNTELVKRLDRVKMLEKEISKFREKLAQFPLINQKDLKKLQKLDNQLAQASAALNAMAAEVEVIASDQIVKVGDDTLTIGGRKMLVETTEIKVGESLRLTIRPGGGVSLREAREKLRSHEESIQHFLDEFGIKSVNEGSEIVVKKTDLQSRIGKTEAALEALDAEDLESGCAEAREALTAAEADIKRREEQVTDFNKPANTIDAKQLFNAEEDALRSLESSETVSKATRNSLHEKMEDLKVKSERLRETIATRKHELTGAEAQLKLLLENHGTDKDRSKLLESARTNKQNAGQLLATTNKSLQSLQPDLLEADRERLQRGLDEMEKQIQTAKTNRAISQAALRSDGGKDPQVTLAEAETVLESTNEHLAAVNRKAKAIALIDNIFQEEQRQLSDQFSQPLAKKITHYLQCLFGSDVQAVVRFENNAFNSIELVRSTKDGSMSFDSLSGGTREQVAAAVRLAIAELLAVDHENTLPLTFDDAFAYADPERVKTLQRMLDLGAKRGLQIIVLSCNPSDYSSLGARLVNLN